jgi:hypothetical protein
MSKMDLTRIIGVLGTVFIIGFFIFAFRQGLRVKPERREDHGPSVGAGTDHAGGNGGHSGNSSF